MRGCHERRELFNARMVAGGMELGLLHALAKAMFNRPCTSPRRNQCRAGGAPMKPQGWSPNDGWFCWPGADDPERFLKYGRWW